MVGDEEDAVEVVGHELEGDAAHLWGAGEHALPVLDDGLAEGGRDCVGCVGIAVRLSHVAHDLAEERLTPFYDHRYQVDAARLIVVVPHASRHGGLLGASKLSFSSQRFFVHGLKVLVVAKIREKEEGCKCEPLFF